MRFALLTAVAAAAIACAAPAGATGTTRITKHDRDVIHFFQHHPRLAATAAGGAALAKVLPHVADELRQLELVVPTSSDWRGPPWPRPPAWFRHDIACIELGESTNGAGSSNLYGMLGGWATAGGGTAADHYASAWNATPAEQLYRTWVLYNWAAQPVHGGNGWSPWSTAPGCGLG